MTSEVRSICVYCGAASAVDARYVAAAERLGSVIARHGLSLVYGGGRVGLMGIVADAALDGGGRVTGVIPSFLLAREVQHGALTELIVVETMHTRKQVMVERADAFVVLPGGLGTLDEMIEVLTWRCLGLHDKPIVLVNINDYWGPVLRVIDHMVAAGFVAAADRGRLTVIAEVDHLIATLARQPAPRHAPRPARL